METEECKESTGTLLPILRNMQQALYRRKK